MQAKVNLVVPVPVVESVTLTMTAEEAKMLYKFMAGTTSETVVKATGLDYDNDNDEVFNINNVLYYVWQTLGDLDFIQEAL